MGWYDNMLPKHQIEGHRGYYPVTSAKEWDELPALYKVMDWNPVKDPHNKDKLTHVKSVIFNVTFTQPYGISAEVLFIRPRFKSFCSAVSKRQIVTCFLFVALNWTAALVFLQSGCKTVHLAHLLSLHVIIMWVCRVVSVGISPKESDVWMMGPLSMIGL